MRRTDALTAALLLLLVAGLCWQLPAGFWRADDPALLLHALDTPTLAAFSDPVQWQKLSPSNLTPWVTVSFQVDLALGGTDPRHFYLHQALSAVLFAWAAYALARQWLPVAWAGLFVALGLAGAPTSAVVEALMTRHYLEGALFMVLSVLAAVQALRQGQLRWALAGAMAYALSATAKEVYVPLPLVLPALAALLPAPPRRPRWLLLSPWLLVAASYVPWRLHMLGSAVGGYAESASLLSMSSLTAWAGALAAMPTFLLGRAGGPTLVLVLLAAGVALHGLAPARRLRVVLLVLVLVACVFGPLLPLALSPGLTGPDRYLFLPWWLLCAGSVAALRGAGISRSQGPAHALGHTARWPAGIGLALGTAIAGAALVQHLSTSAPRQAAAREFDTVGRFLLAADARSAFQPPPGVLAAWWYTTSLCEVRSRSGSACPQVLIDGWPLAEDANRLFAYDAGRNAMVDLSPRLPDERRRAAAIDRTLPLAVELQIERGYARWRLGPYTDGHYFIVSPQLGRYPLPIQGALRTTVQALEFQIQHDSPTGVTTASPTLSLSPGQALRWSR